MSENHDVVIIGGGPAGATAACLLAEAGHRVAVVERHAFPRAHVGEGLLPFCYPLFDRLGVLDAMKGQFVRKPGVRFVDPEGQRATTWCFDHVIEDDSFLSFHVERARFDALLLQRARSLGAEVHEQTRVRAVDLQAGGRPRVSAEGPGGSVEFNAGFVLDASGRARVIARSLGSDHANPDLRRTALWAHWRTTGPLPEGLGQGISLIAYLGARGWVWVFPLGPRRLTVGVVVDNDALGPLRDGDATRFYTDTLATAPVLRQTLAGCERDTSVQIEADYSYDVSPKFASNYALIGDAGGFVDPIFSSGVYLAMNTARLVAEALDERLSARGPGELGPIYERVIGAYALIRRLVRLFYDPAALSFAAPAQLDVDDHELHRDVMASAHFLLAGDFFDNPGKYAGVLDLWARGRGFGKFRRLVSERSSFAARDCESRGQPVFPRRPVELRALRADEVEAAARLVIETWTETYANDLPARFFAERMTMARQVAKTQAALDDREHGVCGPNVAVDPETGALVAIAHAGRSLDASLGCDAELYTLYVRRDLQQQQVGRRLLAFTVARARAEGLQSMCCRVLEFNRARGFYEHWGARLLDARFERELGGETFVEVAYAWDDLAQLEQRLAGAQA